MEKLVNIFMIILTAALLASCKDSPIKPRPMTLPDPPADAPAEYKQGWKDGCESGLAAYGNDFYKSFYSFKVDVNMLKNQLYYKSWNDLYHYCRAFINRFLADGYMGERFSGTYDQRNLKVTEGYGLHFFTYGRVNTPGWTSNPYSYDKGLPGYNDHFFNGGPSGGIGDFGGGHTDWLNRDPAYQTDYLGRTKEYQPNCCDGYW